jgi:hypothetical protein
MGATNQGFTDSVIQRYGSTGEIVWTRQWGTAEREWAIATQTDGGGSLFVLRYTQDQTGVPAGYELRKLNSAGDLLWSHPFAFGIFNTSSNNLVTDSDGNIFISAAVFAGKSGMLAKLSGEGQVLWSEDLSTNAISIDGEGNLYASRGMELIKYSGSGESLWTYQFGDNVSGVISHLAADGLGNVFVSGSTTVGLVTPVVGQSDAWLALVRDPVPEPGGALLAAVAALAVLPTARRTRRARFARCK